MKSECNATKIFFNGYKYFGYFVLAIVYEKPSKLFRVDRLNVQNRYILNNEKKIHIQFFFTRGTINHFFLLLKETQIYQILVLMPSIVAKTNYWGFPIIYVQTVFGKKKVGARATYFFS